MLVPVQDKATCDKLNEDVIRIFGEEQHPYIKIAYDGIPPSYSFLIYRNELFYSNVDAFVFN